MSSISEHLVDRAGCGDAVKISCLLLFCTVPVKHKSAVARSTVQREREPIADRAAMSSVTEALRKSCTGKNQNRSIVNIDWASREQETLKLL